MNTSKPGINSVGDLSGEQIADVLSAALKRLYEQLDELCECGTEEKIAQAYKAISDAEAPLRRKYGDAMVDALRGRSSH